MGPACVIVVWLFVAAVLASIWAVCFAAFTGARYKKWRVVSWIAAVPVVMLPLAVAAFAGLIVFCMIRASIPRYVYQDTFNEAPSADVRNIQSDTWGFADSAGVFLRFEASAETFHRIKPEDMRKVSLAEYGGRNASDGVERPAWWSPPTSDTDETWLRDSRGGEGRQFSAETELLTYDIETQTVMYFYLGID